MFCTCTTLLNITSNELSFFIHHKNGPSVYRKIMSANIIFKLTAVFHCSEVNNANKMLVCAQMDDTGRAYKQEGIDYILHSCNGKTF